MMDSVYLKLGILVGVEMILLGVLLNLRRFQMLQVELFRRTRAVHPDSLDRYYASFGYRAIMAIVLSFAAVILGLGIISVLVRGM